MAYGFKVLSANGATQIDTSDSNQILYQEFTSGTTTAISGANLLNFKEMAVTVSGYSVGECLVFIRPTGTVTNVGAFVVPSSTGFSIWSDSNTSFYYYVFKKASSLSAPTGYGLVVYAADGTTVQYTSDTLAARVKGRLTGGGTITGSNLFGLGTYQYSRVTQYSFRRGNGDVFGWHWVWSATGLTWKTSIIFVGGGFTQNGGGVYANLSLPSVLAIEAPNP
tara:strand:+ start:2169 stop:2834 length:666 start_codon:yes stop_codon:yes gene_type:complete